MTRMMPFKTKFIPNYEIDWGYQEECSEIPERKTNDVKTINI